MTNAKAELGGVDSGKIIGLADLVLYVSQAGGVYLVGYFVIGSELAKGGGWFSG